MQVLSLDLDDPNYSDRPWGRWERLIKLGRFQVKQITVNPGQRLSLQSHLHRAEHWVVVAGTARVTCNDDESLVNEGEHIYLPLGCTHRMANPGRVPLVVIEVQIGSYLGEDDIIRYQDDHGRA